MEEIKPTQSLPTEIITNGTITLNPDGTFTCKYGAGTVFVDGDYWKSDLPEFNGQIVNAKEFDPLAAIILFCDAEDFRQLVG
jgi:pyridoxal biosynthesis lyase PdxS